jgi:hypothetical protein
MVMLPTPTLPPVSWNAPPGPLMTPVMSLKEYVV